MRIAENKPLYKIDILEKFEKLDSAAIRLCTKETQKEKIKPIVYEIYEYNKNININELIAFMNKKEIEKIDLTEKEEVCNYNFYKFLSEGNIIDSYWELYDYLLEDEKDKTQKITILEKYTLDRLLPDLLENLE